MEPQQAAPFIEYMKRLKWGVTSVDGVAIYHKSFPLLGRLAKIHRPVALPSMEKLAPVLTTLGVRRLVVEPVHTQNSAALHTWIASLPANISVVKSPYLPTKTIRIDLTPREDRIFSSFSEAKRRAVRRALKHNVIVKESDDINALIRVKNASAGLFGFITTTGIKELWEAFSPQNATILLGYSGASPRLIGGVLILFWDNIAYYWIAGATRTGKKQFAPTLLLYEAAKVSKRRGAKQLDLVGVWDERIPRENTSWKGFTKFKEGFGGKILYYPLSGKIP